VFVKLIFVGDSYQVVQYFFLPGVLPCPVWVGFEGKRVQVTPDVLLQ
jgi:hypothetical protein